MKQLQRLIFKSLTVFLCLISIGANGQIKEKVYSENFEVVDNAVLEVNTSYADIEFDTWNKNRVSIETTVQLEGATDEEAAAYFEKGGISVIGNSKKISVNTQSDKAWEGPSFIDMEDLHIEIPEMPEFDFDFLELVAMPMPPEPPMPEAPNPNFDHEAFEKEGEAYLKKWQEGFQKNFGEPYQKKMEEWQQKMEVKHKEVRERREKELEERMAAQNERMEDKLERKEEQKQRKREAIEERIEAKMKSERNERNSPNTFYFNRKGENRKYKIKKTIKIKMPKSTKIKMNVRHGEVKLAEHTNNINATLSHAKLYAATIDGDETKVVVSYSPIRVQKWNYGQLKADYSESIDLDEVLNLKLSAKSSEVTIENLVKTAFINNSFGPLLIRTIAEEFETLDVSLQNAEFVCRLPNKEGNIYMNGTASEFTLPTNLKLDKRTNHTSVVYKGYINNNNNNNKSDKSININSQYSEIILQ
ncbi:hypothetical protein [Zobellia alginiliquefaciens]|uniref:hypothetical protein n=1 Tax=Zobellia alginiliquefaciens TaxID=3032586 RepID=UPI0023E39645|nr:hypothetical protein [Zobellia alginiliquefaciens]